MSWNPITQPIDYVKLGGQRSPGIAEVVGAALTRRIEVRRQYAAVGATTVFMGRDLAKFDVVIQLYTEQDWADWHAWKPLLDKDPSRQNPKGLDIWHPLLEQCWIGSVLIEKYTAPEQTDDAVFTVKITCLEHRPPKFALAKIEGSKATPAPRDPLDVHIQALTKQFQELAAQ